MRNSLGISVESQAGRRRVRVESEDPVRRGLQMFRTEEMEAQAEA